MEDAEQARKQKVFSHLKARVAKRKRPAERFRMEEAANPQGHNTQVLLA
jgi:hypothetical protein